MTFPRPVWGLIDGPIKSALPRDITQMAPPLCLKRRLASEEGSGQLSCHGDKNGSSDLRLETAHRLNANSEHGEKVTEPHGGLTSGAGDKLQHKTQFSSQFWLFAAHISAVFNQTAPNRSTLDDFYCHSEFKSTLKGGFKKLCGLCCRLVATRYSYQLSISFLY